MNINSLLILASEFEHMFDGKFEQQLDGGLADSLSPKDFPREALEKGMKVEEEHTSDKSLQLEIAMDHLAEDPLYYDKLEEMEKK